MQTLVTTLGLRLRAARKAAGFKTAREFSHTQAIAQSTYGQYETGKRALNAEALVRFCRALNINAHWLLLGEAGQSDANTHGPFVKGDRPCVLETRMGH